ncbi:MAG: sigma-70 family RNA polymerase sigma factor [Planctomycetota bacterium]
MANDEKEELFRRFRERGDLTALSQFLDAVSPSLERVAHRFGVRGADAEDLVQAALIVAIEEPGRWNGTGSVTAWLAGILAHEARNWRRREGRAFDARDVDARRATRERNERPAAVLERREARETIARALGGLPARYREILERHLVAEEKPSEIAAALSLPAGTVRVRLHRGLARLRDRLGGGAAVALPASLRARLDGVPGDARGLDHVHGEILAHARSLPTLAPAAKVTASAAALLPPLVMAKRLFLAALVLFVSVLGVRSFTAARPDVEPTGPTAPARLDAVETAEGGTDRGATAKRVAALDPAQTSAPEGDRDDGQVPALQVRTVFEDGTPAPLVHLDLRPRGTGSARLSITTDDGGRCTLRPIPDRELVARSSRGGEATLRPGDLLRLPDGDAQWIFRVPDGVDVRGRVVDGAGRPVARADVWVNAPFSRTEHRVAFTTDADGNYALRDIAPECMFGAHARGRAPSKAHLASDEQSGADSDTIEVDLVLEGPAATLVGQVVGARRTPVAGALVRVGAQSNYGRMRPRGFEGRPPPIETVTDAEGRFACDRARPGDVHWAVKAAGHAVRAGSVRVEAGATGSVRVELVAGGRVRGRVVDGAGAPIAAATVHVDEEALDVPAVPSSFGWPFASTDEDGAFAFDSLAPGLVHLTARTADSTGEARRTFALEDGEIETWTATIARDPPLRGVALRADGTPAEGARISVHSVPRNAFPSRSAVADPDGHFTVGRLPDGKARVVMFAHSTDGMRGSPVAVLDDVHTRDQTVRIQATEGEASWGTLTATLTPLDAPLRWGLYSAQLSWWTEGEVGAGSTVLRIEGLAESAYQLRLYADGYASEFIEVAKLGPAELRDLGVIDLGPDAPLDVLVTSSAGNLNMVMVDVMTDDGGFAGSSQQTSHAEIRGVPPGRYNVRVIAEGCGIALWPVTLRQGELERIEVSLDPGAGIGIEVVDAQNRPVSVAGRVRVRRPGGDLVADDRVEPYGGRLEHWTIAPFGDLEVEVATSDGRRGAATASHASADSDSVVVRVE